jgi:hypothetical protein
MTAFRTLIALTTLVVLAGCHSSPAPGPSSTTTTTTTSVPTTTTTVPPSPPSTYTLIGTVTDATSGGVLPGISVQILAGSGAGTTQLTSATGQYRFTGLAAGSLVLRFAATGYVTQDIPVVLAADSARDVVLARAAAPGALVTLSGTVRDAVTSAPLANVRVQVVGGPNFGRSAFTNASGQYSIAGLTQGRQLVEFSLATYQTREIDITIAADTVQDLTLSK